MLPDITNLNSLNPEKIPKENNGLNVENLKGYREKEIGDSSSSLSQENISEKPETIFMEVFGDSNKKSEKFHNNAISVSVKNNLRKSFNYFSSSKSNKHIKKSFRKSEGLNDQFKKFVGSLDQEKINESAIQPRDLENLQKKASKLKEGQGKLVLLGGKSIFIRKALDEDSRQQALEIHVIAKETFAKGTYGEVRGATNLSKGEGQIAEKRAKEGDLNASVDIKNEYKILTDIHKTGRLPGVQAPPHTVVKSDDEKIIGYIGRRYAGDGKGVAKMLHSENERVNTQPQELIKNLSIGLKSLKDAGHYHFDHKLANTLYSNSGGKLDLVLSDFGGDLSVKVMDKLIKKAYKKKEDNEDFIENLFGVRTGMTTSVWDIDALSEIIENAASLEDAKDEVRKFMESRMVFSQAMVSLELLTGMDPLKMKTLFKVVASKGGMEFKFHEGEYEKFELEVHELCKKYPVSKDQVKILHQSLQNNYEKRPSLEDFSKSW